MKVEQIDRHETHAGVRRYLKRRRARLVRRARTEEQPVFKFRGYSR